MYHSGGGCCQSAENSQGETSTAIDGAIVTTLSSSWTRYWVTWKTNTDVSGKQNVLIGRLYTKGHNAYICGVKFEKGNVPTDWSPHPDDIESHSESLIQQTADNILLKVGNCGIDVDNNTINATTNKFYVTNSNGQTTMSVDSSGNLDVTSGFNVKSGNTTVVTVNSSTNSTGSSNGNITILDTNGLYIKRGDEGFRLTTDGFQRWNSTSSSWVNFYGGRYVRTISLYSTATTLYNVTVNDDFIIAKSYVSDALLNLPSSNIPEGKIITVLNAGGAGIHIRAGSLTIQGAVAYSQVTININDRMEFIYSKPKWYVNYLPKVDNSN